MAQVPAVSAPFGTECRSCWTVDEGNVLVGIDASGLELRMLAHYMDDEDYTNEILNGDIHTANQRAAGLETRTSCERHSFMRFCMEPEMLRSELSLEEIALLDADLKKHFYLTRRLLKELEEIHTDRLIRRTCWTRRTKAQSQIRTRRAEYVITRCWGYRYEASFGTLVR
jgi:hypothetical protein